MLQGPATPARLNKYLLLALPKNHGMRALDIIEAKGFIDANATFTEIHSAVSVAEVQFLRELISQGRPRRTLEIGCALGISSLAICELIGPDAHHTIIDPFQSTDWKGHGLFNLSQAGFQNFKLVEERSEYVLPRLCQEGASFDFVFVDGWHTFDHVMMEFFYIDRMLPVGGIVAFDDILLPCLNRLMRYISRYPNYESLGCRGRQDGLTIFRRGLFALRTVVGWRCLPLGSRLRGELLHDGVVRSDASISLNGSITAFRKTSEDDRGWAWYEPF